MKSALATGLAMWAALLGGMAWAQPAKDGGIPRIGVLTASSPAFMAPLLAAFRHGLADAGRPEGNAIIIDVRYGVDDYSALPGLARALIDDGAAAIVAYGDTATRAAAGVTKTVPIIANVGGDPVRSGFAVSLARPGGNITGLAELSGDELIAKRIELLKEAMPGLTQFGAMWNPHSKAEKSILDGAEKASSLLGLKLVSLEIDAADKLDPAFRAFREAGGKAIVLLPSTMLGSHAERIVALAIAHGMLLSVSRRETVAAGALMSYGIDLAGQFYNLAGYVDRVLKGEQPANLPFAQPNRFELTVNLRTASAIGVAIPPSILARADRVIE